MIRAGSCLTSFIILTLLPLTSVRADAEFSCMNPHLARTYEILDRRSVDLEAALANLEKRSAAMGARVASEERSARWRLAANYSTYALVAGLVITSVPAIVGAGAAAGTAGEVAGVATAAEGAENVSAAGSVLAGGVVSAQGITTVKQVVNASVGVLSLTEATDPRTAPKYGETFLLSINQKNLSRRAGYLDHSIRPDATEQVTAGVSSFLRSNDDALETLQAIYFKAMNRNNERLERERSVNVDRQRMGSYSLAKTGVYSGLEPDPDSYAFDVFGSRRHQNIASIEGLNKSYLDSVHFLLFREKDQVDRMIGSVLAECDHIRDTRASDEILAGQGTRSTGATRAKQVSDGVRDASGSRESRTAK